LQPVQPSRPRRLILYWVLTAVVCYACVQLAVASRTGFLYTPYLPPLQSVGVLMWLKWLGQRYLQSWPATNIVLLPLAWPWLMFTSLMVFQWSMRRRKVRPIHALRCTIYSSGTLVWAGVAGLAVFWGFLGQAMLFGPRSVGDIVGKSILLVLICGLLLSMIYQLIVAYRHYLRFDHAIETVLSALVISLLAPFTVYMLVLTLSY
jgi:hypothetical protein